MYNLCILAMEANPFEEELSAGRGKMMQMSSNMPSCESEKLQKLNGCCLVMNPWIHYIPRKVYYFMSPFGRGGIYWHFQHRQNHCSIPKTTRVFILLDMDNPYKLTSQDHWIFVCMGRAEKSLLCKTKSLYAYAHKTTSKLFGMYKSWKEYFFLTLTLYHLFWNRCLGDYFSQTIHWGYWITLVN